jgi:DNA-binding transcriptional regulator YiaG
MCHEDFMNMHEIGAINDEEMQKYDELCLSSKDFAEKYQTEALQVSFPTFNPAARRTIPAAAHN